jgi:hypothetical protein
MPQPRQGDAVSAPVHLERREAYDSGVGEPDSYAWCGADCGGSAEFDTSSVHPDEVNCLKCLASVSTFADRCAERARALTVSVSDRPQDVDSDIDVPSRHQDWWSGGRCERWHLGPHDTIVAVSSSPMACGYVDRRGRPDAMLAHVLVRLGEPGPAFGRLVEYLIGPDEQSDDLAQLLRRTDDDRRMLLAHTLLTIGPERGGAS